MKVEVMLTGSKPDKNSFATEVNVEETSQPDGSGNQLHVDVLYAIGEVVFYIDDDTATVKVRYLNAETGKTERVILGFI